MVNGRKCISAVDNKNGSCSCFTNPCAPGKKEKQDQEGVVGERHNAVVVELSTGLKHHLQRIKYVGVPKRFNLRILLVVDVSNHMVARGGIKISEHQHQFCSICVEILWCNVATLSTGRFRRTTLSARYSIHFMQRGVPLFLLRHPVPSCNEVFVTFRW